MVLLPVVENDDDDEEIEQLHDDDDDDNDINNNNTTGTGSKNPRWMVIPRYIVLSTITIVLTLTCPGRPNHNDDDDDEDDDDDDDIDYQHHHYETTRTTVGNSKSPSSIIQLLLPVLVVIISYVLSICLFLMVHFSNPGFLTKEMMSKSEVLPSVVLPVVVVNENHYTNQNQNTIDDDDDDHHHDSATIGNRYNSNDIEMTSLTLNDVYSRNDKGDDKIIESSTPLSLSNSRSRSAAEKDIVNDTTAAAFTTTTATTQTSAVTAIVHQLLQQQQQQLYHRDRYCTTCQLQPLIRSHHCKICHHCVATFDHHCLFMGVCIGEGNHCQFYIFLLCQAIGFYMCVHIITTSSYGFTSVLQVPTYTAPSSSSSSLPTTTISDDSSNNDNINYLYLYIYYFTVLRVIIAKLYIYPLTIIAWIMVALHTFFLLSNITTYECIKGPKRIDYLYNTEETMDLPFSHGVIRNIYDCCSNDTIWSNIRNCCRRCCRNTIQPQKLFCQTSLPSSWEPTIWKKPSSMIRDSPDWWNHPWKNKYWSCC